MFESAIMRPSTAKRNSRPGSAHYRRRLPSTALRENAALLRANVPSDPLTQGSQNSVTDCCASCQLILTVTVCGPGRVRPAVFDLKNGISSLHSTLVLRFILRESEQDYSLTGLILNRPGSFFSSAAPSPATSVTASPAPGRVAHSTAAKSARQVAKRLCQEFRTRGLTAPDRVAELSLPQLALFHDVLARCADEWSVRLRFCDSLEDEKRAWQKEDSGPGQLHTVYIREFELFAAGSTLPLQGSDATDDVPGRPPEETLAEPSELFDQLSRMQDDLYLSRCEAKGFLSALETLRPLLQELKRAVAQEERCLRSRERSLKQQFVALVKAAVERERALAELYADSQCWASAPLADIIRKKGAVGHAAADNAAAAQLLDMLGQDGFSILDVPDSATSNEAKQQSTRHCQKLLATAISILRRTLPENVKPSPESTAAPNPETPTADPLEAAAYHTEQDQMSSASMGQEQPVALFERPGSAMAGSVAGMASHHRQEKKLQQHPAAVFERPGSVLDVAGHHAKESIKDCGHENFSLPRVVPLGGEAQQPSAAQDNLEQVARLLKRVLGGSEVEANAGPYNQALAEAHAWISTSQKVNAIRENLVSAVARCQDDSQTMCQDLPQIAAVVANCQNLAAEMAAPEQPQKCVFHTIHSDSEEEEDVEIPSDIASIPTELGSNPESQKSSPSGCRDGVEVDGQLQLHQNQRSGVPPSTPKPPAGVPTRILSDGTVHVRPRGCTVRSTAHGPPKGAVHSGMNSMMQCSSLHNSVQRQRTPNANSRNGTGRASTPRTPRMRSPLSGLLETSA